MSYPVWNASHIYMSVINLESRSDRWEQWNDVVTGIYPSQFRRQVAISDDHLVIRDLIVDGYTDKLGVALDDSARLSLVSQIRRSHEEFGSNASLACILSHYLTWVHFLEHSNSDAELLVVAEDDVELSSILRHYDTIADFILDQVPQDPITWDIWLVGYVRLRDCSAYTEPQPTPQRSIVFRQPGNDCLGTTWHSEWVDVRSYFGAHMYVLHRQTVELLVTMMQRFPLYFQVEAFISRQAQLGRIRIIAHTKPRIPLKGTNNNGVSNIAQFSNELCDLGVSDVWISRISRVIQISVFIFLIAFAAMLVVTKSACSSCMGRIVHPYLTTYQILRYTQ